MLHVLTSADDAPSPSPARAAIVTVVIGNSYQLTWLRVCAQSWVAYADRYGLDLIVINDRIDLSDVQRSPAWQKLLILSLPWAKRYERIVWLDCDIIIAPDAPDIVAWAGPPEKVGVVADSGRLSPVEQQVYLERLIRSELPVESYTYAWANAQRQLYKANGIPPHDTQFNTGVMVLSPAHHDELLRGVYGRPQLSHLCEQPDLSHVLLSRDLAYPLSPRFNWGILEVLHFYVHSDPEIAKDLRFLSQFIHLLVRAELSNAYFLHFFGAMDLLKHYAENLPLAQAA